MNIISIDNVVGLEIHGNSLKLNTLIEHSYKIVVAFLVVHDIIINNLHF